MYIWDTKRIYSLLIILILSGCGGGSQTVTETTKKAIHQGQVRDSLTGNVLDNVKVTIDNVSKITDTNGFYSFTNLNKQDKVTINFSKDGYMLGSTQIKLIPSAIDNNSTTNYLEYNLYPHDYQYVSQSSVAISTSRINIDSTVSYNDIHGEPYNDTISINISILDDNEKTLIRNFPGTFEGINTNNTIVQFETYGMITILVKDNDGNKLNFSDGDTGTLIFTPTISQKYDTLPLWYYNYNKGIWVEEGYAQLQEDGTYRGEISHLGTWSLNKPIESDVGIYRGRIIDENGLPISYVRLSAVGKNWLSKDLSTDNNGVFEIKVIPDSNFKLTAYDYKNKYWATYSGMIDAIASGDVVEN